MLEEPAIRVLPRALAKGRVGERYRFGWKEEPEITRGFSPSENPEPIPELDHSTDRALQRLNEWEGGDGP